MTSGTADKARISDILSGDVLFPTESLASPNQENEINIRNKFEEEEEEHSDEELIDNTNKKHNDKNSSLEIKQQQIISQNPNDNNDNIQNGQKISKEDDINTISEQFLSGEKIKTNDPTLLSYVVSNLEERRDQLMMDGDFRNSMAVQKAVDAARSKQIEAVKKKAAKEELKIIRKKQKDLESKYKEFEEQMKNEEDQLEYDINMQIECMREHHKKQIVEHDQSWQNESKLRQYNRASQRLRVLRTQQQLLMNAKRFDEAEHVCKIADGVAQQEALESYKQMLTAYKNSRRILEEKQEEEMDTLMRTSEQKREIFQHQKEVLTQPFLKRINNLKRQQEIAQDPERLWILKYRNDEKKMKSYNGAPRNTQTDQLQTDYQDQPQDQTQTRTQTQNKNMGQTTYQYQEKKRTIPDYNTLDLPPLFGSTDTIASPKKGKSTKKTSNSTQKVNSSTQKVNDTNQIDITSNQKAKNTNQNDITSNQKAKMSTQKTGQKDNANQTQPKKVNENHRPHKTSNLNEE